MGRRRNPFRGVMDTMSEMARMREYAEGGRTGGGAQDARDRLGPDDRHIRDGRRPEDTLRACRGGA